MLLPKVHVTSSLHMYESTFYFSIIYTTKNEYNWKQLSSRSGLSYPSHYLDSRVRVEKGGKGVHTHKNQRLQNVLCTQNDLFFSLRLILPTSAERPTYNCSFIVSAEVSILASSCSFLFASSAPHSLDSLSNRLVLRKMTSDSRTWCF